LIGANPTLELFSPFEKTAYADFKYAPPRVHDAVACALFWTVFVAEVVGAVVEEEAPPKLLLPNKAAIQYCALPETWAYRKLVLGTVKVALALNLN
jgi:hypothetical protein